MPLFRRLIVVLGAMAPFTFVAPAPAQTATPQGYATQRYTPPGFALPDGNGCAGAIARWQAEQGNDYASGNVSLQVYNQIQNEIDRAAAACQAGQDAQARKMVADSRRRHGYPQ